MMLIYEPGYHASHPMPVKGLFEPSFGTGADVLEIYGAIWRLRDGSYQEDEDQGFCIDDVVIELVERGDTEVDTPAAGTLEREVVAGRDGDGTEHLPKRMYVRRDGRLVNLPYRGWEDELELLLKKQNHSVDLEAR